jgi:hypothetical protein
VDQLAGAVRECEARVWRAGVLRRHAEAFREEVFQARIRDVVRSATGGPGPMLLSEPLPATA